MSLLINIGDTCVINSERDSIKDYNGVVCQVATYYPAEIDETKISNLHDVIVLSPAFGVNGHTVNTLRLHPSELVKINLCKSMVKFVRSDITVSDQRTGCNISEKDVLELLEKYIDEETMSTVARQIFQTKMNQIFDKIYDTRCNIAHQSLYDEIMVKITEKQLEKLQPELDGVFMDQVKREILRTDKPVEGDDTFQEWLRFALQRKAEDWIKKHQNEVYDLMQDSIQVAASHLSQDKLCDALGAQVAKILQEKF